MLNTVAGSWDTWDDRGGLGDNRGLAVTVGCGHGVCDMFFTSFLINRIILRVRFFLSPRTVHCLVSLYATLCAY